MPRQQETPRWIVGVLTGILLLVLALFMVCVQAAQNVGCWMDWKDSGRQWRFQYGPGTCQVHDGKGWVPASRVRVD